MTKKRISSFSFKTKNSVLRKTQLVLFFFIVFCFSIYALVGAMLFFFQDRFLYHPSSDDFFDCEGFENYTKKVYNNTRFYSRERSDTGKVIVYYHGNGGSTCDRAYLAWRFERQRTSLLFVEYAGYGGDLNDPSIDLLLQDAKNMNSYIENMYFNDTIVIGESLGTGVASYHASLGNVDKLILVAPFYSTLELARNKYLYPDFLVNIDDYTNNIWLSNYTKKLGVIHGKFDRNIPIEDAYKLYFSVPSKDKRFYEIPYAKHNDVYRYWDTYRAISDVVDRDENLGVLIRDEYRVS